MSFPTIHYKKIDHNALAPFKANESDAGYDIFAHSGPRVIGEIADQHGHFWKSIQFLEYGIGLSFEQLNIDSYLQIYPRSSIINYNLLLCNNCAIIDPTYQKEVLLRFRYLPDTTDYTFDNGRIFITINMNKIYQVGNKIAQIIPSKVYKVDFVEVNEIKDSGRGGFGSTGIS